MQLTGAGLPSSLKPLQSSSKWNRATHQTYVNICEREEINKQEQSSTELKHIHVVLVNQQPQIIE